MKIEIAGTDSLKVDIPLIATLAGNRMTKLKNKRFLILYYMKPYSSKHKLSTLNTSLF